MRAWLVVCAALALAPPCRATAARPHQHQHQHQHHHQHQHQHHTPATDPARLDRIKSQILAKLGLSSRPTPLGAPPRDVVRQILARAADADAQADADADPHPTHAHAHPAHQAEQAMREVIAIAHRGTHYAQVYGEMFMIACPKLTCDDRSDLNEANRREDKDVSMSQTVVMCQHIFNPQLSLSK